MLEFIIKNMKIKYNYYLNEHSSGKPFRRHCCISDKFFSFCAEANRLLFCHISPFVIVLALLHLALWFIISGPFSLFFLTVSHRSISGLIPRV